MPSVEVVKPRKPLTKGLASSAAMMHLSLPTKGLTVLFDSTPSESSPELAAAVGQIIAQHVHGGDVGQLLEGMEAMILPLILEVLEKRDRKPS